jgi:hypothetical protein
MKASSTVNGSSTANPSIALCVRCIISWLIQHVSALTVSSTICANANADGAVASMPYRWYRSVSQPRACAVTVALISRRQWLCARSAAV